MLVRNDAKTAAGLAVRKPITDRERELLAAIVKGQKVNGYAPTRRELAGTIGISVTRVQQLVDSCTEKGLLSRRPRMARAYVVHQPEPLKKEGRR
jgi:SOS-response transcriptional repressor LexA